MAGSTDQKASFLGQFQDTVTRLTQALAEGQSMVSMYRARKYGPGEVNEITQDEIDRFSNLLGTVEVYSAAITMIEATVLAINSDATMTEVMDSIRNVR